MNQFQLFAFPWWVNLFILVPLVAYYYWQGKLSLQRAVLVITALFGIAFGFVEAAVVVYLRVISGNIHEVIFAANNLSSQLLRIEAIRELATIIMILSIALAVARNRYDRWAVFFWVFAFWDIFYYAWLRVLIGWPQMLVTKDVLFLIPAPWFSEVWFPILISLLLIVAVVAGNKSARNKRSDDI